MIALPALLLVLACKGDEQKEPEDFEISEVEDSGTPLDSGETDSGDSGEDTGTPDDTGEEQPSTDRRSFAMLSVIAMLVTDPSGFSDDQEISLTTSWSLVDWTREGTALRWTETLCGIESSEVFDTTTSFPDAFVETMPVRERTGTLSSATTGASLEGGPYVDLVGVELEDPAGDDLPDDPDDDSVIDQDGDGNPGVTVLIDQAWLGEGEAYVAQRNVTTYDGVVVSTDRVEGYLDATTEQQILDASTWWLLLDAPPPEPDPDPTHSYFVMQQVDDDAGCAEVLAARDELF